MATRRSALFAYMRSVVRMNATDSRHVDGWSEEQVLTAFHTVPAPAISFEAWAGRLELRFEDAVPDEDDEYTVEACNERAIALTELSKLQGLKGDEVAAVLPSLLIPKVAS